MKKHLHISTFTLKLALVFSMLIGWNAKAQTYPVQAHIITTGPYLNYLSYYGDHNNHLQITLTNLDFNAPSQLVRLRLRFEGSGWELFTNPNATIGQPFLLDAGMPLTITGIDLLPYLQQSNLINPNGIDLNNLPKGFTNVCVDVIRESANHEVLSTNNCGFLPIQEYQPPQAFVPFCGDQLDTATMFHNFTWTPPVPFPAGADIEVYYDFSIRHWIDPNNNSALGGNSILVYEQTGLIAPTTQVSDFDVQWQMGGTYIWTVTARVLSNGMPISLIENGGVSAPCTFVYGESLSLTDQLADGLEIELFTAPSSERKGKAWWTVTDNTPSQGLSTFDEYFVEYRKQPTGNEGFEIPWFSKTLTSFEHFIYQLEPSTTYQVRVSGVIAGTIGNPTPIKTFTTPDARVYNCGEADLPYLPNTFTPLENATVGTQVQIGQFTMTLTELNEFGGGHYAGKGEIPVAFLGGAKAKVRFDDILIDTEYLVHEGRVDVITDGLDNWLNEQYQQFIDPYYVNGTIDSAWVDTVAGVAWVTVDGVDQQFTFDPPTYPIIVNDENGNQYTIFPDGTIVISNYLAISETWSANADEVVYFTQNITELRGFDAKEHMQWHENYEIMMLGDSSKYFVANKSLAKDEGDYVNVEIPSGVNASFEFADGTPVNALPLQSDWLGETKHVGSTKMTLFIPARSNTGNYSIYAFANNQKVGQLNVQVFSKKERELVVVPVASTNLTAAQIKAELDNTLGEANLDVDVEITPQWTDTTGTFTALTNVSLPTDVGLLNKYSDDMRELRDLYFEQNPNADKSKYYLFVVNGFDEPNEVGYMVRGRSMGFVKANQPDVLQTISHELAHGMGALSHTWKDNGPDEGTTNNLMDYASTGSATAGGNNLIKAQWKELRDLDVVPSLFDEVEDASYSLSVVDYICIPANVTLNSSDVFVDLDFRTVKLDQGYSPYAFVGSLTPNIAGCLAMVVDSVGNVYWPSAGSGSTGYYRLKADGSIDATKQYIPSTGTGPVVKLTTETTNYNQFVFTRNNAVVLSQISTSIRCIQFEGGGTGTGVQIPLTALVYADTTGAYNISSGLQSPVTNTSYDGILDLHGRPVKLSSLSNVRIRKELRTFEMDGNAYIPLFSDYGNKRLFAGYIEQFLFDSLQNANSELTYGDIESSVLPYSSFEKPSTGDRIVYRLYDSRLGDCYEEYSFVHSGLAAYSWQEAGSRYKNEIDRRTEWRGCGAALLAQLYCESVSAGLEGFGTIVSGLLDNVRIDEKYYDPTSSEYDPSFYDLFNELNPTKWAFDDQEAHAQFAFLCGIVNGVFTEVEGLAHSLGTIADYFCDQNFRQEVNTAISNLSFDEIKNKVSSEFEGNVYQKAHKTGEYTVMALTIIIPITKVNWAAKIVNVTSDIANFSTRTMRFLDKVKTGTLSGFRTTKRTLSEWKKVLFKKSTGTEIVLFEFTDEGVYVIEPTVFGQVDNSHTLVYEIGEVNYKVGSNGAEEIGVLALYQKGDEIVVVANEAINIPSSLATKLGSTTNLENWLKDYQSELGSHIPSLLNQLDNSIGTRTVLESLEDAQGRFVTVLERPKSSNLVSVIQKDVTGNYKIVEYSPGYNPSLNPSINVPLSFNRLVPDYSTTSYIHPLNDGITVKIEMSGVRGTDFTRSRKKLKELLGLDPSDVIDETDYTWHHLDDFEIINGKPYCTMQLTESSAHQGTGVIGMQHSGSVAQYKAYYNTTYK